MNIYSCIIKLRKSCLFDFDGIVGEIKDLLQVQTMPGDRQLLGRRTLFSVVILLVNTIHDGVYGIQGPPQE